MHLWAKFRGSTLSRFGEIGIESCQKVSAVPTDKPYILSNSVVHRESVNFSLNLYNFDAGEL
jgi:hypothetical protein